MYYWAVIGKDKTRKSTTIYSLSGANRIQTAWELMVHGERKIAYVDHSSAQERTDRNTPEMLIAALREAKEANPNLSHAMLAFHHRRNGWPDAVAYLEALKENYWECIGIVMTSPNAQTSQWIEENLPEVSVTEMQALPRDPSNHIANSVRGAWGL
ncbi:hypothetical protein [Rhodobacter maris]|uniref:AAA domain-containing protein n=1 Tax=Rhodobacter maris TaxID=446682 RepID=A0A285RLX1_9RHOB|nr:hypothetical protein [Rhodobacter maris]SOB94874.1 hypothetical protein SAMN05877831_101679 [Rhodobacter maris]